MKNFQLRVQSSDNKKVFKSLGPAKPATKKCVKTISKKEQEAIFQSYIVKRQKLKESFKPKALQIFTVHNNLPKAPKVSKNTIACTHLHRMIRNLHGLAQLVHVTINNYK